MEGDILFVGIVLLSTGDEGFGQVSRTPETPLQKSCPIRSSAGRREYRRYGSYTRCRTLLVGSINSLNDTGPMRLSLSPIEIRH